MDATKNVGKGYVWDWEDANSPPPVAAKVDDGKPNWRWMQTLTRIWKEDMDSKTIKGYRPAPATFPSDPVIAQYVEPYLRHSWCFNGKSSFSMNPNCFLMETAEHLYRDKDRDPKGRAYRLEAGVMAGLEPGALLPVDENVSPLIQRLYEDVFFAVRPHLADREWLLRHIFNHPWHTEPMEAWGFQMKVYAYSLGPDGYSTWISNTATDETLTKAAWLMRCYPLVGRYLRGLSNVDKLRPGDAGNAFRKLFEAADRADYTLADEAFSALLKQR